MGIELFAQVEYRTPGGGWCRWSFHELGKDYRAMEALHSILKAEDAPPADADLGGTAEGLYHDACFNLRIATVADVRRVSDGECFWCFRLFAQYVGNVLEQGEHVGAEVRVLFWEF